MIDALLGQTLIQPELQDRLGRGGGAAAWPRGPPRASYRSGGRTTQTGMWL